MNKSEFLSQIERWPLGHLWTFAIKQAWAALFGELMLLAIIVTHYIDLPFFARYDWLFIIAIVIQGFMLLTRLEKPHEVITIVLFHLVGLGMELFKTSAQINSWSYPGEAFFHLGNVPLFSGFMYAAVGSYMARAWRVLNLDFSHYPNRVLTCLLGAAIYINFFTHHYIVDLRYILFAVIILLYGRVIVTYRINTTTRRMPLVVGFGLIAFFIWIAENLATYSHAWSYPNQILVWQPVGFHKVGSWLLLMVISFILVDMLYYIRTRISSK